ncbi:MAG: hypothetical protein DM484_25560 [Candidatus Methylumidiphilus alinenensis]|uniref:Uncharacterized protein n=1 Tax=Candidatus Methylumidiphilus alinenensis TaxID=2202197 RepID=A0A2W4QHY0_9GAMM|nr:MAG: hypothetical protein DM484_25560 [Candidatus Methylumidiphilus alinenensis]
MLDGLFDFLQNSWQQFHVPIEQLAAVFGVIVPIAGMLKYVTYQFRLKRVQLHKLQEFNDYLQEQIKALQRELKKKDEAIAGLESQFPEQWLRQAAKERENGNEERAIRCLREGFKTVREPLSACCLDLAAHHFSLVSDYGNQHFAEAERLARLAVLLHPSDEATGLFLAEILAVAAEGKYATGNLPASDALWEEAEDFLQVGKDADSITSIAELARQYYDQGHYQLAVRLFRRAMQMSHRFFGPDTPNTLTLRGNHASALQAAGRYGEALAFSLDLLADRERVCGSEHPDVANSFNNLAELYQALGQYTQADPFYQRSLAIMEKALGPNHPNLATGLRNYTELLTDVTQRTIVFRHCSPDGAACGAIRVCPRSPGLRRKRLHPGYGLRGCVTSVTQKA